MDNKVLENLLNIINQSLNLDSDQKDQVITVALKVAFNEGYKEKQEDKKQFATEQVGNLEMEVK